MRAGTTDGITAEQAAPAALGLKGLVPIHGRAFLEWGVARLVRAGVTDVILVVGPHTAAVRRHFVNTGHLPVRFVEQSEPLGSADAVLAAEAAVGGRSFLVVNADNLYAVSDLARLADLSGPGLIGFTRSGLERGGIPADRLHSFALIEASCDGALLRIIEKPAVAEAAAFGEDPLVSMTCWRFGPEIFEACRAIERSRRGEYELPDAVRRLLGDGVRFTTLRSDGAVLDLSSRADIRRVESALHPEDE